MPQFTHAEILMLLTKLREPILRDPQALTEQQQSVLEKLEHYAACFGRANDPLTGQPRPSPRPCEDDCLGWCISHNGSELGIERCDACWNAEPEATRLDDEDYRAHPVCQEALESAYDE
jgi:hypothetical protein